MEENITNQQLKELAEKFDQICQQTQYKQLYQEILATVEKSLIKKVLALNYGNQIRTAKMLGINRNTLRTKIKKLNINPNLYK